MTERNWFALKHKEHVARALERQLDYQERKAERLRDNEKSALASMMRASLNVRKQLEEIKLISLDSKILEVGSGAHGLIFSFGKEFSVGIDPLAVEYAHLFPLWQRKAQTIAALGEQLPFADASFDVVLSDNVIDHAEKPFVIVEELARVLTSGGLLYFTVSVHHPFYSLASDVYGISRALGLRFEISPLADHTVHLTAKKVRKVLVKLPFQIVKEQVRYNSVRNLRIKYFGESLKRVFFKNVLFEAIAVKVNY